MKNLLLYASIAALLGIPLATAQEKTAAATVGNAVVQKVSLPSGSSAYSADDIKIEGTIDNGQTSKLVEYARTPSYRAFVFEGNGNDRVEITVLGANQRAFVALADQSLNPIASGIGRLSTTLPYHGPDTEAFYILIKGSASRPTARLAVHLKKTPAVASGVPDATR